MWDLTIEKLENHKYRLYVKWDGTEEMLSQLLEDGFSVSDKEDTYYSDYEDNSILFNFGMSMCECYNKLINNHLFTADYILHCIRQTPDASLIKEVEEKISPYNRVKAMIDCFGMEAVLRLVANNYDSLVEEATRRYQDMDEVSFLDWLKESIEPRFKTQVLPEIYNRYLDVNKIGTKLSDLYCGYWVAWQDVLDNWEGFMDWVKEVEFTSEVDVDICDSFINHKDNMKKQFYIVYFWGYGKLAKVLFEMLNDPTVLFKVKMFIQDVLKGCAQNDSEFAGILQKMYSEYKSIVGGIDIDFAQQVFENESFVFPTSDVKKHLSNDIVDDDKSGFVDMISPIYNDPEKLTRLFCFLVECNYINKNDLDTAIYRFTGKRKPRFLVEKIHWKGSINDLLYIFKKFYGGEYDKIKLFFEIEIEEKIKKNYSSYADRPNRHLIDLFVNLYTVQYA